MGVSQIQNTALKKHLNIMHMHALAHPVSGDALDNLSKMWNRRIENWNRGGIYGCSD